MRPDANLKLDYRFKTGSFRPRAGDKKGKEKSRKPAWLRDFSVAGAEGLEPSARGFGASDRGYWLRLTLIFCYYPPIKHLQYLLNITKQFQFLL